MKTIKKIFYIFVSFFTFTFSLIAYTFCWLLYAIGWTFSICGDYIETIPTALSKAQKNLRNYLKV